MIYDDPEELAVKYTLMHGSTQPFSRILRAARGKPTRESVREIARVALEQKRIWLSLLTREKKHMRSLLAPRGFTSSIAASSIASSGLHMATFSRLVMAFSQIAHDARLWLEQEQRHGDAGPLESWELDNLKRLNRVAGRLAVVKQIKH